MKAGGEVRSSMAWKIERRCREVEELSPTCAPRRTDYELMLDRTHELMIIGIMFWSAQNRNRFSALRRARAAVDHELNESAALSGRQPDAVIAYWTMIYWIMIYWAIHRSTRDVWLGDEF